MKKPTNKTLRTIWMIAGFVLCILPPAIVSLHFFPVWLAEKESATSIAGILVLLMCCIPFRKHLTRMLKSPSAWQMWTIIFVLLFLLGTISHQMLWVSGVGAVSGVLGAICFRIAKKYQEKDKET